MRGFCHVVSCAMPCFLGFLGLLEYEAGKTGNWGTYSSSCHPPTLYSSFDSMMLLLLFAFGSGEVS
jgi:hypothetical protein